MKLIAALVVAMLMACILPVNAARAGDAAASDTQEFQRIIAAQIQAFRADDGPAAYSYAAPLIQKVFPTSDVFMDMVRKGYQPVYRPRVFDFGNIVDMNGQPTQRVHVVGPDGRRVNALYLMTRLPDGSWRIDGCFLQAPEEHQV